jgi:hypothetical protein
MFVAKAAGVGNTTAAETSPDNAPAFGRAVRRD